MWFLAFLGGCVGMGCKLGHGWALMGKLVECIRRAWLLAEEESGVGPKEGSGPNGGAAGLEMQLALG